ncbi:MAG: 4Fe-4S binding protein [Gammaproteobacteria bacterium]
MNPIAAIARGGDRRRRVWTQAAFLALFVLAPPLDLLRFDLHAGHAWFLGMPWRLGVDDFAAGRIDAAAAALRVAVRLVLPIAAVAVLLLAVAWRWGRVYCGWLCPHFSVVETLNGLLRRAIGRHSLWDRAPGPIEEQADGSRWLRRADGGRDRIVPAAGALYVVLAIGFAFLWAVVLLTYLLPPAEIYAGLAHGALTRNQATFIVAATCAFSIEFLFARHLFCRYGCAVGLFQSIAWMSNPRAMTVDFDRARAADCARCPARLGRGQAACEDACPMRLNPRTARRRMFACTQCASCIRACGAVQRGAPQGALLGWADGEREPGPRPWKN